MTYLLTAYIAINVTVGVTTFIEGWFMPMWPRVVGSLCMALLWPAALGWGLYEYLTKKVGDL